MEAATWFGERRRSSRIGQFVSLSFWLALVIMLFGRCGGRTAGRYEPPASVRSAAQERLLMERAERVYAGVMEKADGTWTPEEVVAARASLYHIRERFQHDENYERVQAFMSGMVHRVMNYHEAQVKEARQTGQLGGAAYQRHWAMQNALMAPTPDVEATYRASTVSVPLALLWFLVSVYLLAMPFAFLTYIVRVRDSDYTLSEELVFGWQDLVIATVCWPVGLFYYAEYSARSNRRARVRNEYFMRKPVGYRFTAWDEAEIDRLVNVPMDELRARLEAIREVPQAAVFHARMAFYTAMFVGMLIAPLRAARAQGSGGSAGPGNHAAAVETFHPSGEAHGFIHIAAGSEQPFGIPLAWARGIAHAAEGLDFQLLFNPASGTVLETFVIARPDGLPFGFRIGQFPTRITFMTLPPHREKLIGGSGVGVHVLFRDVGVEAFDDVGDFQWSLAGFSGSGINKPDENDAKDVVAHIGLKPWGSLLFELGLRAGEQPDGFRMHAMAHVNVATHGLDLDLHGSRLEAGSVAGVIGSAVAAYRPQEGWLRWLEWAAGFDEVRPGDAPQERVVRGEVNVFAPNNHARFGLMYGRQLVAGTHNVTGRIQMEF